MSMSNTYRLLKREDADREKIARKFSHKSDEKLIAAIANPEHSTAARKILQELASQRGLQSEEARGWVQTEASMYVAPFGKRPTLEQAMAAPHKRRRVYRTLQVIMLLCWTAAILALRMPSEADWINEGIETGQVNPDIAKKFVDADINGYEKLYRYMHGRNRFADGMRRVYVNKLVAEGMLEPGYVDTQLGLGLGLREIVIDLNQSVDSEDVREHLYYIKAESYEQAIEQWDSDLSAEIDSAAENVPEETMYAWAFSENFQHETDYLAEHGADTSDAFDYYANTPVFEPEGPKESVAVVYFAVFFMAGFVAWYPGGVFTWLSPSRVLLLRPFQSKQLSKPLARFVRKNLAFRGHITTLADKYMKESRLAFIIGWIPKSPQEILMIPLFFIPAIRQLQRWLYVSSPRSYRLLKNRQARRFTLNMFWVFSFNKLLKVRCSDTWWKNAVDLLMYTSQLIVVDLSLVKEGTEWELHKIDLRDLENKTIFIVSEDAADYARVVIARFWPGEEAPPPLFLYQKRGDILEREAYERETARIISQSHLWVRPSTETTVEPAPGTA